MMTLKNSLTVLALVAILTAGCSSIMDSKQDARQHYMLSPVSLTSSVAGDAEKPALALSLTVVPGLDTDRVLALSPDARLSPYANARWPDHLPEVLSSVLRRSLMASGRFSSVTVSRRNADGGWLLEIEVQQFYGIRGSSGETDSVRVEMSGAVVCNGKTGMLNTSESTRVSGERLAAVVAAHQQGLDAATRQLLQQIEEHCA